MKTISKLKSKFIPVNTPKIYKDEKKYVNKCLSTGWISSEGKYVKEFEKKFSKFINKKYGVAVSSGTAALEVAMKSLNLKKKSEVIIPNFSIISTALCVVKLGLKPVLVDVDPVTWNMSPKEIFKKINKNTKAIIITHIYGFPVEMKDVLAVARKKKIKIIEDTAEMIGQTYNNKKCGSFGDLSTFSFYANKHITTGEGGMILTNDKKLYSKCASLRNLCFGSKNRFDHDDIGWNYRMTNLQAAMGCGQLNNISKILKRKREIGKRYISILKKCKHITIQPYKNKYATNIFWVFGILLNKNKFITRDKVVNKLKKRNIQTRNFFYPMYKQKILKQLKIFKKNQKFQVSDNLSMNGFYLPSGLGLTNSEIDYVGNTLLEILQ